MVGVLTAAGLSGGLALFLAQMATNQHAVQMKAETGVELTALSNRINTILYDGDACGNSLRIRRLQRPFQLSGNQLGRFHERVHMEK